MDERWDELHWTVVAASCSKAFAVALTTAAPTWRTTTYADEAVTWRAIKFIVTQNANANSAETVFPVTASYAEPLLITPGLKIIPRDGLCPVMPADVKQTGERFCLSVHVVVHSMVKWQLLPFQIYKNEIIACSLHKN